MYADGANMKRACTASRTIPYREHTPSIAVARLLPSTAKFLIRPETFMQTTERWENENDAVQSSGLTQ